MLADEWKHIITKLGADVRQLRGLLGWSQQELADRSVVSQGSVSRMESGSAEDIPLRSVVLIVRSLSDGLAKLDIALSPEARALLGFAHMNSLTSGSVDNDLLTIIRALNQMTTYQRRTFVQVVRAMMAWFGEDQAVANVN